jgi:hypothetical protein
MSDMGTIIGASVAGHRTGERSCRRIAVVFEPGASGGAALRQAAALGAMPGRELTVVGIAPQATGPDRCGPSPDAYNCAVRDEVAQELREATALLGRVAEDITVRLLVEGSDPPLENWVAQGGFDIVLLPARRRFLRSLGHPAVRRLQRLTDAEVRVVDVRGRERNL